MGIKTVVDSIVQMDPWRVVIFVIGNASLLFLCWHCWWNNFRKPQKAEAEKQRRAMEWLTNFVESKSPTYTKPYTEPDPERRKRSLDALSGKTTIPDTETLNEYLKNISK